MSAIVPPHDLDMESALIGAMLMTRGAISDAADAGVTADDFYKPEHAAIYAAIVDIINSGAAVDPVTVSARMNGAGVSARRLRELQADTPASANSAEYAAEVTRLAQRRRLLDLAYEVQIAIRDGEPVDALVARLAAVRSSEFAAFVCRVAATLADLFFETPCKHDWLIDELLERTDRVVLTGIEGGGKSTLLRQIAVGAALGMNTLSSTPFAIAHRPVRTLIVDCENSRLQLRREFEKLRSVIGDDEMEEAAPYVHLECRTDGLVLDLQRDTLGDRAWLEGLVAGTRPDLLMIGPLYKMLDRDPTEEAPGRDLAKWLDRLRVEYDFALVLEAHSPHGEKRPYGWSGWKRWPEFGIHLGEDGTLTHWRGQREERAWPRQLRRGVPMSFPWTPSSEPVTETHRDTQAETIAEARLDALRAMRKAKRPLSRQEIVDRVPRRKAFVLAAIAQLEDENAFIVTTENRPRADGKPYPTKLFHIDPHGPESATK